MILLHYSFVTDKKLSKFLSITIKSIIDHNRNTYNIFHIISNDISKKDKKKLQKLIKHNINNKINFYEIDDSKIKKLYTNKWPIQIWYRILLPEILSEDINKVLYLDVDTLIVDELKNIFLINLENKSIAGTLDVGNFSADTYTRIDYDRSYNYICDGVLLINLKYWREFNLTNKIISWAAENSHRLITPEQDAINQVCHNTKVILPLRYNIVPHFFKNSQFYLNCNKEELKACLFSPAIIHFTGCLPWKGDSQQFLCSSLWLKLKKDLKIRYFKTYYSKGIMLIKVIIWNITHPNYKREFNICENLKKLLDL